MFSVCVCVVVVVVFWFGSFFYNPHCLDSGSQRNNLKFFNNRLLLIVDLLLYKMVATETKCSSICVLSEGISTRKYFSVFAE